MAKTIEDNRSQLFHCPVEALLSIIGGKYKAVILFHLIDHTLRFSEIRHTMPQATPKMLTQQLRELETDGVIHREVYPVVPPKTEYSLTEYGKTLAPLLKDMCAWGEKYMGEFIIPKTSGIRKDVLDSGYKEEGRVCGLS